MVGVFMSGIVVRFNEVVLSYGKRRVVGLFRVFLYEYVFMDLRLYVCV